ncbi:deoxyribodipyrimidine photolyase [Engelhardtia mirabilis]|uniref:Deoxyribodipyrimidine photo-lyase n=1 Tax=Engelhardtia mirabilis TaxID=2528011 RepID=A0A518BP33_9BACT|nr:FAD binding domain of DNA photolyase [Planctomycetes bacterium Pla133]QDV03062.1 FAD binding domain of DNA photolyase [Planctomycetes bacterium Pla86]
MSAQVPQNRITSLNGRPIRAEGEFVLYWMIANRRPRWNFALQRAVELAAETDRPLLVLEPLRAGYRWASDRHHAFVLQGMAANRKAFAGTRATYRAYVEPEHGAGAGLVESLAARACAVVTDDWPCFFLPRMTAALAGRVDVATEAIDSNGIYPQRSTDRVFTTAASFRRHLQKNLYQPLQRFPLEDPLADAKLPRLGSLPAELDASWPEPSEALLSGSAEALAELPIDHGVTPVDDRPGGWRAGRERLAAWLESGFARYHESRNDPVDEVASGLSPWLHFGHLSAHEVFAAIARREKWSPDDAADVASGSREGWWGMSPPAESFLDELITWREIGFNRCTLTDDYDRFESLPAFARETLEEHTSDPREHLYGLETFERAETHDELWNAAQTQLVRTGRIHNYLRMLWGKKVLEWTATPREALDVLIELNNKYALDGRDPNSYSGIFWTLGRYDRAWGPERPVFGKIRFMSSDNTRRKLKVGAYLEQHGPGQLFN